AKSGLRKTMELNGLNNDGPRGLSFAPWPLCVRFFSGEYNGGYESARYTLIRRVLGTNSARSAMKRTASQNVVFHGPSLNDDPFEPPGRSIATTILHRLRADGFAADDEDNWRDGGWSIDVELSEVTLQVVIGKAGEPEQWIAQVATLREPGVVAQLFGWSFVDRSDEVLSIACAIDRGLREAGYTDILWRVDGFPDREHSTPLPEPSVRSIA
ncbi:MAG: hypothetical protein ACREHD_33925, partial [Pirellulales bacterium]